MHINMASQTVREHFQLSFVVWLTMALPTVRDFAMFLMTPDTANLPMFTRRPLPFAKNVSMATTTGLGHGIIGNTYP
jgi:hypothetical protein